jgi:hypothetical protein
VFKGRWPISWILAIFVGVLLWAGYGRWRANESSAATTSAVSEVDHSGHAGHDAAGVTAPIVTTTIDSNGVLYAAAANDDRITVAVSRDFGQTFEEPAVLTPAPETLDANGEARPKIVIGRGGEVLVSWTRKGSAPYTGDIRFSRSVDGGRTFSVPVTVNDDRLPIGHRFDSLGVAPDGTVVLAWIDKRDLERATAAGQSYDGAAIYVATSSDGGANFTVNRKAKDHVCECCRIGLAFEPDSTPVLLWRDVLPGSVRDHVVMRITPDGPSDVRRVSYENWAIEACPHHGPALAVSSARRYHFAWFTGAESTGKGVFYANSDDAGVTVSQPIRVGRGEFVGHPSLAVAGGRLWLAWKEWRDDDTTEVHGMRSDDDGRTWTAARRLAVAPGNSDRPFLVTHGNRVFLSWTDTGGLRVTELK